MLKLLGATAVSAGALVLACYAKLKRDEARNAARALEERVASLEENNRTLIEASNVALEAFSAMSASLEQNKEVQEQHLTALEANIKKVQELFSALGVRVAALEEKPQTQTQSQAQTKKRAPEKNQEEEPQMASKQEETQHGEEVDPKGLFVGNIPRGVNSAELAQHFKKFGRIQEVRVNRGQKKYNYGFMKFKDERSVQQILQSGHVQLPNHQEGCHLNLLPLKYHPNSQPKRS